MRLRLSYATFVPVCYWWLTCSLRAVLFLVGRWTASGREHVPAKGALIVAANHLNNADPPILAAAIARRRLRLMAKVELFRPPFGFLPRLYGAFPVRRFEADIGAMLTAERLLKKGEVLGMFPEGTRSRTGYMGELHPGTALIALRTGAPVLPCAITGTEILKNPLNVLRKPRITVTIGEPIRVVTVRRPTDQQVRELTARITAAIRDLLPASYLRTYTGNEAAGTADGGDSPGN